MHQELQHVELISSTRGQEQALASREGELPDGSQQRAVAYALRMARVDWQDEKDAPSAKEILLALGGGTGAGTGAGKLEVDRDILRRRWASAVFGCFKGASAARGSGF